MATSAVSSTTSASTAAATLSANSASSATSAQAASKAAAQKIVTSLGSGSGVDVNSLAQNLVDAERIPRQTAIQNKIDKNTARVSGLSAMYYMLSDLKAKLSAMKDKSSLSSMTAASSSAALSATAEAGASLGSHEIRIDKLASAQRYQSAGFASETATLNGGNPFQVNFSKAGLQTGAATSAVSSAVNGRIDSLAVNGRVVSLSGIDLNGYSDYASFSVDYTSGGTTRTLVVTPEPGWDNLEELASDLQTKLQQEGVSGITVEVDDSVDDQLNITVGSDQSVSSPALQASTSQFHMVGLSFGSTPAVSDFTEIVLGTGLPALPLTLASATPDDLASAVQDQLGNGYTVTAVGDESDFRLDIQAPSGASLVGASLTANPESTASAGALFEQSSVGNQLVASVGSITLGGGSDFSSFSVSILKANETKASTYTVTPTKGLTTIAALVQDIQAKLNADSGIPGLAVTVDATNQINVTSTGGNLVTSVKLVAPASGVHLDGIKFSSTPAASDFKIFSVSIDGQPLSISLGQTEATGDALASYIQDEVSKTYPDVTVSAVGSGDTFSLYLASTKARTFSTPKLNVLDMNPPTGLKGGDPSSPAGGVKLGTAQGATVSGIALGSSASNSLVTNLKAFTVTIGGVATTVKIDPANKAASTVGDLAAELQRQLRATLGGQDISVTSSGSSITVASASGRAISGPMLSATTLSNVSFATTNPSTQDFRAFQVNVDGYPYELTSVSPKATTLDALAESLQAQLRAKEGSQDISVTASNGGLQFWSASGRSISDPVLSTNAYSLTPADLARAINDKKIGLTAQVLRTGGGTTPYRLVVSGSSGADQAFTIGSTAAAGALDFSKISDASDAEFSVDGVQMTRSSNTVSDALKGVTLSFKGTTPGGDTPSPASLEIGMDTTSLKTKMSDLVASYNDTFNVLSEISNPKSTLDTYGGTLVGDSIVRSVRQQIRSLFQGISSTPGASVSALWQMGIKVDQTGVMSFDSNTFDATARESYADVVKSLTGNFDGLYPKSTLSAGFAGDGVRKLNQLLETASNGGVIKAAEDNANSLNTKYQADLTKLQTRMDALLVRYQKQLASMDSLVGQTNTQKTSLKSTFEGMMSVYTNN